MSELRELIAQIALQGRRDAQIDGTLGRLNAGGSVTIRDNRLSANQVYCRLLENGTVRSTRPVINRRVANRPDLPVKLEVNEQGELEVAGIDLTRINEFLGNSPAPLSSEVGPHSHRIGLGLEDKVEALRFEPGLLVISNGLTLTINEGSYVYGDNSITLTGLNIDLTGNQPGMVSQWRWVLVTHNPITNALTANNGATYPVVAPLTSDMIDAIALNGQIPLLAVKLRNGQTSFGDVREFVDRRNFIGSPYIVVEEVDGSPSIKARKLVVSNGTLSDNGDGVATIATGGGGGTGSVGDYILIRDEKAQNTAGGGFTSGAWQTRTLNTEVADTGGHASIGSNQITLASGTYRVFVSCPAYGVEGHQARLYNITDSSVVLLGTSEYAAQEQTISGTVIYPPQGRSIITGRFTLASTKVLEVQHRCNLTKVTNGLGVQANLTTEIYTIVELVRES
jgi:hypothetical protein